jgi:hypothetical protein
MIKQLVAGIGFLLAFTGGVNAQASLEEHGMSSASGQVVLANGTIVTSALGAVQTGPLGYTSLGSVSPGWLHAHVAPASGNDCPADLNQDGMVSTLDLLVLLADFGCTNACNADINGDGLASSSDLLLLLASYGEICP